MNADSIPKKQMAPRRSGLNRWLVMAMAIGVLTLPAFAQSTETNSVPSTVEANAAASTQAELIQKLLTRIEKLEAAEVDRNASAQKANAERVQKLEAKILALEEKVVSLESGKVIPEIVLAPQDSPTLAELDQKIRVLQRQEELAAEVAEAKLKTQPKISLGQSGFSFSSADTNFVLKVRGLIQFDSRTFFDDNSLSDGNDSFLLRRARPIIEGTVFRDFDFNLTPDFAGSSTVIQDAYLNYKNRPELQLRAGKFKSPVGLELLQSDANLSFNERSLVSALVPNRDIGVQLWGDVLDGRISYAAALMNGVGDARNTSNSDFDDEKEFAGNIFLRPFKLSESKAWQGLGFGVGGSYSQSSSNATGLPSTTGGTRPGYVTDGQQQFFAYNPTAGTVVADGTHWRLSPHITYLNGPFGFLGEYAISNQEVENNLSLAKADLEHKAWQISAQWVLTGEPASFTGITPEHPFDFSAGRWGAWQLVARYGQLKIDDATFPAFANPAYSAKGATAWSVGVNWWLNKNIRFLTSFSHTTFDGGGNFNLLDPTTLVPPATVTAQDENVLFTRLQISF